MSHAADPLVRTPTKAAKTKAAPTKAAPNKAERATVSPMAATCSITGTVEALGDAWSILVLRELFFGVRRFNDIQIDLAISRSVLTDRLNRLVDLGVVRTEPYQEPGDRVRKEYRLTRKGVDLLRVIVALMEWGDKHLFDGDVPVSLHQRGTGDAINLELRTTAGERVQPNEIEIREHPKQRTARTG